MAYDITTTAQNLQAHLIGSALFSSVEIGTPNSPEPQGPTARIYFGSARVVETTLTNTIEVHVLQVRLYLGAYMYGEQERSLQASILASQAADYIVGDFTLGGTVRNVDIGGQYGDGLAVEFTDEETQTTPYHVATLTVPLIVDGATAFVA